MEVACDFQSMGRYATARLKWAFPTFGNDGKRIDIISENLSEFMFENIFWHQFGRKGTTAGSKQIRNFIRR